MKKRLISLLAVLAMMVSLIPSAVVQAQMNINIGDYVQMGTYYGKPILWRCVDKDENGPLMLSDKILCIKAFDAEGDNTSGSHGRGYNDGYYRKQYGSNYWADSNMRDWLNSESGSVAWSCGNPPDKDHLWNGYNAYDKEAGFLTNFTQSERNAMLTVTQKSLLDGYEHDSSNINENYHIYNNSINNVVQNYDTAYSESVTDKMFLLDVKQVNNVYNNLGDYYTAYPTQECVDNSEYKNSSLNTDSKWDYWLRSPGCDISDSNYVRCVSAGGYVSNVSADNYDIGVRPAFYLNLTSSSTRGGAGTEYDPYTIDGGSGGTAAATAAPEQNNPSDWARDEVDHADVNGIVPDEIKEKYQEPITRREFCLYVERVVNKFFNKNDVENFKNENRTYFSDTDEDCIMLASALNIVNGYDDSTFRPDNNISRQEAAVMIYRLRNFLNDKLGVYIYNTDGIKFTDKALGQEDDPNKFYDVRDSFADGYLIADWAVQAIDFTYYNISPNNKKPIMGGTGEGNFSPLDNYTCEQSAISFVRFFDIALQAYASKAHEIDQELANDALKEEIQKEKEEKSVHLAVVNLDNAIEDYANVLYSRVNAIKEAKESNTETVKDKKKIQEAIANAYYIEPKSGNNDDLTSVKDELYEAMYDYTSEIVVESIRDKKDEKKLVKALFKNMQKDTWTADGKKYNGYSVEINPYGGYGKANGGIVTLSKNSKSYVFFYNSTEEAAEQAAAEFMNDAAYLARDLSLDACVEVVDEITSIVAGQTAKQFINSKISDTTKKYLKKLGIGDIEIPFTKYRTVYNSITDIHDIALNTDLTSVMPQVNKLYKDVDKFVSDEEKNIKSDDPIVNAALGRVNTAYENLKYALYDYLYTK